MLIAVVGALWELTHSSWWYDRVISAIFIVLLVQEFRLPGTNPLLKLIPNYYVELPEQLQFKSLSTFKLFGGNASETIILVAKYVYNLVSGYLKYIYIYPYIYIYIYICVCVYFTLTLTASFGTNKFSSKIIYHANIFLFSWAFMFTVVIITRHLWISYIWLHSHTCQCHTGNMSVFMNKGLLFRHPTHVSGRFYKLNYCGRPTIWHWYARPNWTWASGVDIPWGCVSTCCVTRWGRDEIDAILQTTFWNAFSWMKSNWLRLKFHWNLFPRVQLTIFQHWFR